MLNKRSNASLSVGGLAGVGFSQTRDGIEREGWGRGTNRAFPPASNRHVAPAQRTTAGASAVGNRPGEPWPGRGEMSTSLISRPRLFGRVLIDK